MIEVNHLVRKFGSFRAVDDISFSVPKGQVLGFLGPNGAGKSTTMKVLTCFIEPTSGTASVGGKDVRLESIAVRKQIGYLPESAPSYGEMTVEEFLIFIAEMRGFRGKNRKIAAEKMRELCFLDSVWFQAIETLSKGYRQRVGFAQSLIHDPPVLILDEPTDGLDPNQKHEVRQLIKNMGQDKTIILSTHILEEVEAVCQRVIIIAEGKLVADETPMGMLKKSDVHNAVTISFASPMAEAKKLLGEMPEVKRMEYFEAENKLRLYPKDGRPIIGQISQVVRELQLPVQEIHIERGRLDDVFRHVTTETGRKEG